MGSPKPLYQALRNDEENGMIRSDEKSSEYTTLVTDE